MVQMGSTNDAVANALGCHRITVIRLMQSYRKTGITKKKASVDTHADIPNSNSRKPQAVGTSNVTSHGVTGVPPSPTGTSNLTSQEVTSVPTSPTDTSEAARHDVTSISPSPTDTSNLTSQEVTSVPPSPTGTSEAARHDLTSISPSPTGTSNLTSQEVTSVPPSPTGTSEAARHDVTSISPSPTGTSNLTSQEVTSVPPSPTGTSYLTSQDVTSVPPSPTGTSVAASQDVTSISPSPAGTSNVTSQDVTSVSPSPTGTSEAASHGVTSVPPSPTGTSKLASQDVTSDPPSPTGTSEAASHDVTSVPPSPTCTVQDVPTTKDVLLIKDMDRKRVYFYSQPLHQYLGCQELKMKERVINIEYCSTDHQLKWMLQNGKVCHYNDKRWHCNRNDRSIFVKCDEDVMIYMTNTELWIRVGRTTPVLVTRVYKPILMTISRREKYLYWATGNRQNHDEPRLYQIDYRNKKRRPPVTRVTSDRYVSHIKVVYPRGEIAYICNPTPLVKFPKKTRFVPFRLKAFKNPCVDIDKFGHTLYILTPRKLIAKRYRSTHVYHDLPLSAGRIMRGGVQYVQRSTSGPLNVRVPPKVSEGNKKPEIDHALMVKDVRNKVVHLLKLPEGTTSTKMNFPEGSTAVDVEFYPPSEEVIWISKHNIAATPLKQPKRYAETIEDWKYGKLLTVKHDVELGLAFYVTSTGNIYKKTWRSTEDATKIQSRIQVVHMALDVKHKHIYCIVYGRPSMYLKRLSYDAKGMETILRKNELLGLSVDQNGDYVYLCGPQAFRRETSGTPIPVTLYFNVIKGKCWDIVSDLSRVYILEALADIQIVAYNWRTHEKQVLTLPEKIYSGTLQLISVGVNGASSPGRQNANSHRPGTPERKAGSLLIMDCYHRQVMTMVSDRLEPRLTVKFPRLEYFVDIQYSADEDKFYWITPRKIYVTPVKTQLKSTDISQEIWSKREFLSAVRKTQQHTLLVTTGHIYRCHGNYHRYTDLQDIGTVNNPTRVQLDTKHRYILWTEKNSDTLYRLSYIRKSQSEVVKKLKQLGGFSFDPKGTLYYCGPSPRMYVARAPRPLGIKDECLDIAASGHGATYALLRKPELAVIWKSDPTKTFRLALPRAVYRGGLKIVE